MNLLKVFYLTIKNSIKDFWINKKWFFVIGLILLLAFVLLIWIIFYSVFHYLIVYIPWWYIFAPKILWIIIMFIFYFIIFLTFIATIPTMFKNKEINLLFTLPIKYEEIFRYWLVKLIYFASYGSILVLLPIFVAYWLANDMWILYFAQIPIIILLLTILATLIGSFSLWVVNLIFFPLPKYIQLPIILIAIIFFIFQWINFLPKLDIKDKESWLSIIENYIFTFDYQNLFSPFNRFTKAIFYIWQWQISKNLIILFFVISTIFLFYEIFLKLGSKLYIKALENFEKFSIFSRKKKISFKTIFTNNPYINLFIKDLIIHIKDPVHWSQILVFVALLFVYIAIIKWSTIWKISDPKIVNILSLWWLALVGFFVGWIALRFIFPNVSLEWKSFWVLKLAPIQTWKLFLIKLIFFNLFILISSFALIYSYVNILWILDEIKILIYIITFFVSIFITSIFFSLWSAFPNFIETNPSKIATSYGGLLSIFLSNAVVLIIITILWNPMLNYYQNKVYCQNIWYEKLILFSGLSILILIILTGFFTIYGYRKFKELEVQ